MNMMYHSDCVYPIVAVLWLSEEVLVTFYVDIEVVVPIRNAADNIPSPTVISL